MFEKKLMMVLFLGTLALSAVAAPCLAPNGNGALELRVKERPFLMIAGEMHNSSATTARYLEEEVWPAFAELNANTALAAVGWDQLEPQEGQLDFTVVDDLVRGARKWRMKVVLLWFGAWKNGRSQYVPAWVKTDAERFVRVTDEGGRTGAVFSPACPNLLAAESRTFAALMRHLKEIDGDEDTVVMVQVENEVGYDRLRDASAASSRQRAQAPNDVRTNDVRFAAYQFATYAETLAQVGRREYDVPFYANAWLDRPGKRPGEYPNGGPVPAVLDVWRTYAPTIRILAPDIYDDDFIERCRVYGREGNPLFIPESKADIARAFWAFGAGSALGFAPFGFEGLRGDAQFAAGYGILSVIRDEILSARGSDRMTSVWMKKGLPSSPVVWTNGAWRVTLTRRKNWVGDAYGLIIRISDETFTLAGKGFCATFASQDPQRPACMLDVREFDERGLRRVLNGDEVQEWGLCVMPGIKRRTQAFAGDYQGGSAALYSADAYKTELYPGILRVRLGVSGAGDGVRPQLCE